MNKYIIARKDSVAKSKDPDTADLLRLRMSDISEEYYCAGWLRDLEFMLWSMVKGGSKDFGLGHVSEEKIDDLRRLSDKCGGWWIWLDVENDPSLSGEIFIPLEAWYVFYNKFMGYDPWG